MSYLPMTSVDCDFVIIVGSYRVKQAFFESRTNFRENPLKY